MMPDPNGSVAVVLPTSSPLSADIITTLSADGMKALAPGKILDAWCPHPGGSSMPCPGESGWCSAVVDQVVEAGVVIRCIDFPGYGLATIGWDQSQRLGREGTYMGKRSFSKNVELICAADGRIQAFLQAVLTSTTAEVRSVEMDRALHFSERTPGRLSNIFMCLLKDWHKLGSHSEQGSAEAYAQAVLKLVVCWLCPPDTTYTTKQGEEARPLILAVDYNDVQTARALLEAGADPGLDAKRPIKLRAAPLHLAAGESVSLHCHYHYVVYCSCKEC